MREELFPENMDAQDKLRKAKDKLRESYYSASDFSKLVSVRDAAPEDDGFLYMNYNLSIPRDWFTIKNLGFMHIFAQFGENLAYSEEKYIVDYIFKEEGIPRVEVGENKVNDFVDNFKKFSESSEIQAILAPINLYINMHTEWLTKTSEIKEGLAGELSICNTEPFIFWSNKYTPFDDFVFINKSFAEWISKPSFKDRLEIKVTKSDKMDKLDLLFFTKMKLNLVNPKRILILHRHF